MITLLARYDGVRWIELHASSDDNPNYEKGQRSEIEWALENGVSWLLDDAVYGVASGDRYHFEQVMAGLGPIKGQLIYTQGKMIHEVSSTWDGDDYYNEWYEPDFLYSWEPPGARKRLMEECALAVAYAGGFCEDESMGTCSRMIGASSYAKAHRICDQHARQEVEHIAALVRDPLHDQRKAAQWSVNRAYGGYNHKNYTEEIVTATAERLLEITNSADAEFHRWLNWYRGYY